MAPNPRVASAFRAMRSLGITEEIVKPVLKNLLKLYDKNWELIEEENYRALADAIFDKEEETQAAEQKKKHEKTAVEMDEEEQVHEEPEHPLKRLRLRYQEGHASPSFGGSSPKMGGTLLIQPKLEESELPETCPQQHSQDMIESSQPTRETARAGSHPLSPQPLIRNKGKQVQEIFEPSQPGAADRMQPFATKRIESDSVSPPIRLREKGKEPLLPQMLPSDKKAISERSSHSLHLKEQTVKSGIVLSPKQQVPNYHALIKPKDEPVTDGMPQFEIPPITVIHPVSLSKDNSSSENGSIRETDGPGPLVSQFVHEEDRSDGILASSSQRKTNWELANIVGHSSSNLEIASSPTGEETMNVTPPVDLLKQPNALDARDKPFGPNGSINTHCADEAARSQVPRISPSSNDMDDCTQTSKNTAENSCEIDKEKEQNGLNHANSHNLRLIQQRQLTPTNLRSLHDVNDIAKGQERVVISLVNEVNNEGLPSFHYISQNVVFQNACVNFTLARIGTNCCSTCFANCLSLSTPCACSCKTGGGFAYTSEGIVNEDFLEECISLNRNSQKQCLVYCKECPLEQSKNDDILEACKGHLARKFIKECWWKCGCSKQCGNRVVQRGINCNLQVFMTPEGKGWGLRTLEDLPKGAFVCEYVGEILTNAEFYERIYQSPSIEEHAHPVLLDADWVSKGVSKDEEALCLDGTYYGNVARFINHRCFDSNLVEIPVEVETPDHHYYHVAFFTTRKVEALEELTWDYGIGFDDHDNPFKAFTCRCGSEFCRNIKRSSRSRSAAT